MSAEWVCGKNWSMVRGNCIDVMPTLARVDHICTDPPYEVESHTKARRSLKDATQKKGARNKGEVRRIDEPLEIRFAAIDVETRAKCGQEFSRLAQRWVIAFCQIEAIAAWRHAFVDAGLDWVRGGIWRKPNGTPQFTGDRPGMGFESLAIAHPKGRKRWNGGGRCAVWTHALDHKTFGGSAEHPTMKPLALMLALVEDFTDEGETVLDPFAGSGSTGVACLRRGRRFVGIEKDPTYFRLACERLRAEESSSTLSAVRAGQVPMFGSR